MYTRESITHARTLLNPGGVIVLSFEAQKPYILDRMRRVLKALTSRTFLHHQPVRFRSREEECPVGCRCRAGTAGPIGPDLF